MKKEEVIKILVQIESVYSYCMTKDETVTSWFEFCRSMDFENVMAKNINSQLYDCVCRYWKQQNNWLWLSRLSGLTIIVDIFQPIKTSNKVFLIK
jgi:hypothetical protein